MSPHLVPLFLALSSTPAPWQAETHVIVTVVDGDGQGLPGATVEFVRLLTRPGPTGEILAEVGTDDAGAARFIVDTPGLYSIRGSLSGFLPAEVGPVLVDWRSDTSGFQHSVRLVLNPATFVPVRLVGLRMSQLLEEIWGPFHAMRGDQLNDLRETVLRAMISVYDKMPPQYDDPTGRRYCLAFDRTISDDGYSPPAEFSLRFADDAEVHELGWCDEHDGRVLSVGPVVHSTERAVLLWTLSRVNSRPGGSDCLRLLTRKNGSWQQEGECLVGGVYN